MPRSSKHYKKEHVRNQRAPQDLERFPPTHSGAHHRYYQDAERGKVKQVWNGIYAHGTNKVLFTADCVECREIAR